MPTGKKSPPDHFPAPPAPWLRRWSWRDRERLKFPGKETGGIGENGFQAGLKNKPSAYFLFFNLPDLCKMDT